MIRTIFMNNRDFSKLVVYVKEKKKHVEIQIQIHFVTIPGILCLIKKGTLYLL